MFIQSTTWTGGEGTGDALDLGPSLGKCTSAKVERKLEITTQKEKGIVTVWNDFRGFGFIELSSDKSRVFVHIKDLRRVGIESLGKGDQVAFDIELDRTSRQLAINICILNQRGN